MSILQMLRGPAAQLDWAQVEDEEIGGVEGCRVYCEDIPAGDYEEGNQTRTFSLLPTPEPCL